MCISWSLIGTKWFGTSSSLCPFLVEEEMREDVKVQFVLVMHVQDATLADVPRNYYTGFCQSLSLQNTENITAAWGAKSKLVPSRTQVNSEMLHLPRDEIITVLCP